MAVLTYKEAINILQYEPETGKLIWKPRPEHMFQTKLSFQMWTARFSGKEAFCSRSRCFNYFAGEVGGKRYLAHRVAWLLMTGDWPKGDIDHIDGNSLNNRFANLRDVTHQQNTKNQKLRSTNRSGVNGVTWCKKSGKWLATIKIDGRYKYLGEFSEISDAAEARAAANRKYGFSERHGVNT